jgi:hypothetical protein
VFKRKCSECGCEITYISESGYDNAIKNNSICRKCASSGNRNGMYGKTGQLNPFYGKKHSEESKAKIIAGRDYAIYKTKEFKAKISKLSSGSNNPMYGKSIYSVWFKKYGKEIADQKMVDYRKKQSELNSGEGNSMYGKPSPTGSGNGWSGWYNGWFFRSLRELSYMVEVIERFNLEWVSGESNNWRVPYVDYKGTNRNYFPDFIIGGKYVVEIKPRKLWFSDTVIRKRKAAEKFYSKIGLKYKITDITCISEDKLVSLHLDGKLIFTDRYEIKFKEWQIKKI